MFPISLVFYCSRFLSHFQSVSFATTHASRAVAAAPAVSVSPRPPAPALRLEMRNKAGGRCRACYDSGRYAYLSDSHSQLEPKVDGNL